MDLHGTVIECYETAKRKGFWDDVPEGEMPDHKKISEKLMLIVGELSEAHEELRKGVPPNYHYYKGDKPEGFGAELADAVIRIFDLAHACEIPLAAVIEEKMTFNNERPHRHGKKF